MRKVRPFVARFESLEPRCLLASAASANAAIIGSAPDGLFARPLHKLFSLDELVPLASSSPVGLTPAKIRHAYGFDQITFGNGIVGDGAGQTVAVIDAYHAPTILNDVQQFSTAF